MNKTGWIMYMRIVLKSEVILILGEIGCYRWENLQKGIWNKTIIGDIINKSIIGGIINKGIWNKSIIGDIINKGIIGRSDYY
jgi:hypothetical protein